MIIDRSKNLFFILALAVAAAGFGCSGDSSDEGEAGDVADVAAFEQRPGDVPADGGVDGDMGEGADVDAVSPVDTSGNPDMSAGDAMEMVDAPGDLGPGDVVESVDQVDVVEPAGCYEGQDLATWVKWKGDDAGGTRLEAACADVTLAITVLEDGVVRLRFLTGEPVKEFSYAVVGKAASERTVYFQPVEGGDGLFRVCTPEVVLDLRQEDCSLSVTTPDGHSYLTTLGAPEESVAASGADGKMVSRYTMRAMAPAQERYYGFGEKTGPLNKRGRKMAYWNSDRPGYGPEHDPLYQSIPFFIGYRDSKAYGLFVDHSPYMTLNMASQGLTNQWEMMTEMRAPDLYFIAGPQLRKVVRSFTKLTGKPDLMPRWTLGYHQCRWSYYPDTQVKEIANELRSRKIPADGMWLDIDYMDGYRSFTWDPVGFSDPQGLVQDLEEDGFKVTAIIDPGLKHDPGWQVYDDGVEKGYFLKDEAGQVYVGEVWPGPSVFPDFTNPGARDWWGSLFPALTAYGVRGVWLDMNEPASFKQEFGWTVPNSLKCHGDGFQTTMADIHNVYALLECRATHEALKKLVPNRRPFILTRAGFAGIQRYAAVWTGDAASNWPALRMQLPMMMNMGLSGVPMVGSDVGGWEGGATPELFARWVAVGAISPFFRAHVQSSAQYQEPWQFGAEVEEISRIHIGERYTLLPYWYTLMHHASETGDPMIRPMIFEFQGQSQLEELDDQAMIGPWLLTAPALEQGQTQRSVTLPEGKWLEYYSGAVHQGPATLQVALTLQAMPFYLREGAIVPKGPWMEYSDAAPVDPLTLELFPSAQQSTFEMVEDDGETPLATMSPSRVTYSLVGTAQGAEFLGGPRSGSFVPAPRRVLLRFRAVDKAPSAVTLDGVALASQGSYGALAGGNGWFFDGNDRSLWVSIDKDADFQVVATYDPVLQSPEPAVQVTFRVSTPPGTPQDRKVHVATSLNNWAHVELPWVEGQTAQGTVTVPRGVWFEYKYTLGDWESVEKWAGCLDASNRYTFSKALPVKEDTVEAWNGFCVQ